MVVMTADAHDADADPLTADPHDAASHAVADDPAGAPGAHAGVDPGAIHGPPAPPPPPDRGRPADPPPVAAPPTWRDAPVTYGLLAVYVVVFGIEQLLGPAAPLTLWGAQLNDLVLAGEWWRVLTATMLHSGLMHLAFNGYALYLLGPQLERSVGSAAFAGLYVASGLAGGLAFLVGAPSQAAVGASGAIFGLFGAYLAAAWSHRDTPAGRAGLTQLGVLLLVNLALPLVVPNIAWQAHLGGLVAGLLIGLGWSAMPRGRSGRREAVAVISGAAAAVLLAGLLWYT